MRTTRSATAASSHTDDSAWGRAVGRYDALYRIGAPVTKIEKFSREIRRMIDPQPQLHTCFSAPWKESTVATCTALPDTVLALLFFLVLWTPASPTPASASPSSSPSSSSADSSSACGRATGAVPATRSVMRSTCSRCSKVHRAHVGKCTSGVGGLQRLDQMRRHVPFNVGSQQCMLCFDLDWVIQKPCAADAAAAMPATARSLGLRRLPSRRLLA